MTTIWNVITAATICVGFAISASINFDNAKSPSVSMMENLEGSSENVTTEAVRTTVPTSKSTTDEALTTTRGKMYTMPPVTSTNATTVAQPVMNYDLSSSTPVPSTSQSIDLSALHGEQGPKPQESNIMNMISSLDLSTCKCGNMMVDCEVSFPVPTFMGIQCAPGQVYCCKKATSSAQLPKYQNSINQPAQHQLYSGNVPLVAPMLLPQQGIQSGLPTAIQGNSINAPQALNIAKNDRYLYNLAPTASTFTTTSADNAMGLAPSTLTPTSLNTVSSNVIPSGFQQAVVHQMPVVGQPLVAPALYHPARIETQQTTAAESPTLPTPSPAVHADGAMTTIKPLTSSQTIGMTTIKPLTSSLITYQQYQPTTPSWYYSYPNAYANQQAPPQQVYYVPAQSPQGQGIFDSVSKLFSSSG